MKRWLWIAVVLFLAGCASQSYRYDDDGYWLSAPRASSVTVSVGWGGCGAWGGPYGGPWYGPGYRYGYPPGYGGWLPCGYGYGPGYGAWYGGGYWHHPWWGHPWYLPPRTIGPHPAGERARRMAGHPSEDLIAVPRYDDLVPARGRDFGGGGGRAAPGTGAWAGYGHAPGPGSAPRSGIGTGTRGSAGPYFPTPPQSLGSGRLDPGAGMSGSLRSSPSPGSWPSSGASGRAAQPRSASGAARSTARDSREEQ